MPQSSVAVRMKISFSSSRILRDLLQRPDDQEIGEKRGGKADTDAEHRPGIGSGMQIVAGSPGRDNGRHHQRAVRQVEYAGDAEDQGKSRGAQRVERTDREAVDQDLPEHHAHAPNSRQEISPLAAAGGENYERPISSRQLAEPSLMKAGNFSLPLATLAGHRLTCLPFCHCSIRPLIVAGPILSACGFGESLPLNWTRPIVPT